MFHVDFLNEVAELIHGPLTPRQVDLRKKGDILVFSCSYVDVL